MRAQLPSPQASFWLGGALGTPPIVSGLTDQTLDPPVRRPGRGTPTWTAGGHGRHTQPRPSVTLRSPWQTRKQTVPARGSGVQAWAGRAPPPTPIPVFCAAEGQGPACPGEGRQLAQRALGAQAWGPRVSGAPRGTRPPLRPLQFRWPVPAPCHMGCLQWDFWIRFKYHLITTGRRQCW